MCTCVDTHICILSLSHSLGLYYAASHEHMKQITMMKSRPLYRAYARWKSTLARYDEDRSFSFSLCPILSLLSSKREGKSKRKKYDVVMMIYEKEKV